MALTERINTLQAHLQTTRTRLDEVLDQAEGREDEQLFADGAQWTIRQLAIHLALAQPGLQRQAMGFAKGEEIIPIDFDINRYNQRSVEKRAEMTFAEARHQLNQDRLELVNWLNSIEDEAILDKGGRTSLLDVLTVAQMMERIGNHEVEHAEQIAAYLVEHEN